MAQFMTLTIQAFLLLCSCNFAISKIVSMSVFDQCIASVYLGSDQALVGRWEHGTVSRPGEILLCSMTITTTTSHRLMLNADDFGDPILCFSSNGFMIFVRRDFFPSIQRYIPVILNETCPHQDVIVSETNVIKLMFIDKHRNNTIDEFSRKVVITPFRQASSRLPCMTNDFQCPNDVCVSDMFKCTGYDHCGDGSNLCGPSAERIAYIAIVSVFSIALLILAIYLVYKVRNNWKQIIHRRVAIASPPAHYRNTGDASSVWHTSMLPNPPAYIRDPPAYTRESPPPYPVTDNTNIHEYGDRRNTQHE